MRLSLPAFENCADHPAFGPGPRGAERYTVDLATALARRGHGVSLLASDTAEPEHRIPATGLTRTSRYRSFLTNLNAHLAQHYYDIVHAMLPIPCCDLYHPHAGIAVEALTKSNIWFNPRRRAMAQVEREILDDPNGPVVLCLSEYIKSFVRKHYPLADERMATLFNAVDLGRFQPRHEPQARVRGLIIANDFARKGLEALIRAVALVREPQLKIHVVGKENPVRFVALARELNVADRIIFAGAVSDPRPLYAAADFFVLPTRHDPCSLVVLEALAMGLPVISTRFNGACEIMTDGVHGFVLDDPNNFHALAEAMKKLMDPELRARMGKACLELRPELSYEHHLDQLEGIYNGVLSKRANRPAAG